MIPYFGSTSKVSEVLNYKRALNLKMMRKLHKDLKMPLALLIDEYPLQPTKTDSAIKAVKDLLKPSSTFQFNVKIG